MDLAMKDKVVLLADGTGYGAGAIIEALRGVGARVCANCPGTEPAAPCDAVFQTDLADEQAVIELGEEIFRRFGSLDGVVFNRSTVERTSILESNAEEFSRRISYLSRAAFICARVLGHRMAKEGHGTMVYMTSLHDEKPNGSDFMHSIAMGMIENLVWEAALDLGQYGVKVNQIALGAMPGWVEQFDTERSRFYAGWQYKIADARIPNWEEVADTVLYLLSAHSPHINGARLRVDGAESLHLADYKANYRAYLAAQKEAGK
jgi:NAD(P)-dependent dehydrogenase (short-subunit alcohol dehydrogenase family)